MRALAGSPNIMPSKQDSTSRSYYTVSTSRSYYTVEFTSAAYELGKAYKSKDYGKLAAGSRVLDAEYVDLVYKLDRTPRWYTPNPATIKVPVELVLQASFEVEAAELPPRGASSQQRQAVALGAIVLPESVHEATMEELEQRHGGD